MNSEVNFGLWPHVGGLIEYLSNSSQTILSEKKLQKQIRSMIGTRANRLMADTHDGQPIGMIAIGKTLRGRGVPVTDGQTFAILQSLLLLKICCRKFSTHQLMLLDTTFEKQNLRKKILTIPARLELDSEAAPSCLDTGCLRQSAIFS